jgi:hypothetical protein
VVVSVHRYQTAGPDAAQLREVLESGLSVSSTSGSIEVDITLIDDNFLPDLDVVMSKLGYKFVSTSPADPRATSAGDILDWTGSATPPLSILGTARIYFDSTTTQLMLSQDGGPFLPFGAPGGTTGSVSGLYACPAGVLVTDAVYLSGAGTVDKADSDDALKQPLIGVVSAKPTPTTCVVTNYGEAGVFAGLTVGATYYLGTTPGSITTVAPSAPGNIVQRIGFAKTATILVVFTDRDWTEIN